MLRKLAPLTSPASLPAQPFAEPVVGVGKVRFSNLKPDTPTLVEGAREPPAAHA